MFRKNETLRFRCTVDEKRAIAYTSALAGKDMSSWLRSLAAKAIEEQRQRDNMIAATYPEKARPISPWHP